MRLLILLLLIAATGCASSTAEGLKKNAAGRFSFDASQNYQAVYRTVLSQARKCYQAGAITAEMVVQGDLYNDLKTGNVTIALHGGLGVSTYLTVDIIAVSDQVTEVDTYYAFSTWEKATRAVQAWVLDGAQDCEPQPKT